MPKSRERISALCFRALVLTSVASITSVISGLNPSLPILPIRPALAAPASSLNAQVWENAIRSEAEMRAQIPALCRRLDLDFSVILEAVFRKDFSQPRPALLQRLERGWEASFQPHWQEEDFAAVLHAWIYLQDLSSQAQVLLSPQEQEHLSAVETLLYQALSTLRYKLPDGDQRLEPPLIPHSGQERHYRLYFPDLPEMQAFEKQLSPATQDRYRYLYRASASQASTRQHEIWALATLLEEPGAELAATAVWRRYQEGLQAGKTKAEAFAQASRAVEGDMLSLSQNGDLDSELLSVINWDTGFRPQEVFFLSGDYRTTALYGSVIFIVEQERLRGIPLNEYGQSRGFYQRLPYSWLLSPKGLWIFAVADRHEYLLPAYLDHSEILGVDVRAEREPFSPEATRTGRPGPLLRQYRKYFDRRSGQLFVYVLDAQEHWIGTLFKTPLKAKQIPAQPWPLSKQKMPSEILAHLPQGSQFVPAQSTS